jgi:RimJ/RimL family protein N-acetyltransferase
MYTFETERLLLRRFTKDDEQIHALVYGDPRVCGRWFAPLRTLDEVRDWLVFRAFEGATDDLGFWAVVRREDGELLGTVALQYYVAGWVVLPGEEDEPFNRVEVELSYALGHAHWGNGYATEAGGALVRHAFERLRIARLVNAIDLENVRSIAVVRRLGFRLGPNLHQTDGPGSVAGVLENLSPAGRPDARHCGP